MLLGDRIMLTFTHMDTEDLRNCSVDFVQVLEGDDLLAPEIGTFCGNTVPTPIISQVCFIFTYIIFKLAT